MMRKLNPHAKPNPMITMRIETLLHERGVKWVDIYGNEKLQWDKSFAHYVKSGKYIPPRWQRIALAEVLGVDSSVIWDENDIINGLAQQEVTST